MKLYSATDDGDFWDEDINLAIGDAFDEDFGQVVTIYECDFTPYKISYLTKGFVDLIAENAVDNCPDHLDSFEFSKEHEEELEKDFKVFIDKWCEDRNIKCGYGELKNIKPIKVKVLSDCAHEVIGE